MLKTVAFIGQDAMEQHAAPCDKTAVISIVATHDEPARIKLGFHSLLRMRFEDLYEECSDMCERVGNVPDALAEDGRMRLLWHGQIIPDIHHARAIINFVNRLAADDSCEHLLVHCRAGVSRSAAVAMFVADRYGAVISQANDDTSGANKRLLRLFGKVCAGGAPVYGKYVPQSKHR